MKHYLNFYKKLHYFVIAFFIIVVGGIKAYAHVVDIHVPSPEDITREIENGTPKTPGSDIS